MKPNLNNSLPTYFHLWLSLPFLIDSLDTSSALGIHSSVNKVVAVCVDKCQIELVGRPCKEDK